VNPRRSSGGNLAAQDAREDVAGIVGHEGSSLVSVLAALFFLDARHALALGQGLQTSDGFARDGPEDEDDRGDRRIPPPAPFSCPSLPR